MKNFKVTLIILLIFIIVLSVGVYGANAIDNTEKAETLKELGMFQGTENGFELHREPTRVESAAMLVRLLGAEKEVMESKYKHPFTDVPKWADNYIGYMYEKGLTSGIGDNSFGSTNLIDGKSYATFVLRALGYSDSNGDFAWENALEFSKSIGLLTVEDLDLLNKQNFKRDGLVLISYNSLKTNLKDTDKTLSERLMVDSVIRPHLAYANNLIDKQKYKSLPIKVKKLNGQMVIDFIYSEVDDYETLGVSYITHIGVWHEPISDRTLMMKLMVSDDDKEIYKQNREENGEALFKDIIDNPIYTTNSMYGIIAFYDKDVRPVFFVELPKNLDVGTYQLPLIPIDKDLKNQYIAEEKKFNEYYEEIRKGVLVFSQSAITIDKTVKENIMIIDRNKLPESLKDFVYIMAPTSNSDAVESAIYREIKSSWTDEGWELNDFSHKYNDETGIPVGNNVYADVYLFSKDGQLIGFTVVDINN